MTTILPIADQPKGNQPQAKPQQQKKQQTEPQPPQPLQVQALPQANTQTGYRLVAGSFAKQENALAWAQELNREFSTSAMQVSTLETVEALRYRVVSTLMSEQDMAQLRDLAERKGITYWVMRSTR